MPLPLVSIVLCTYNGEKFVVRQLETIIAQTYPNIEIIISDDASTDGTRQILAQYKHLPNVKLVLLETNIGFRKNFETAVKLAGGELIALADQDDVWLPHKIETLYNAINGYTLACSNSRLVDENENCLKLTLADFKKMSYTINDSRGFIFKNMVTGHTVLFKKELLDYVTEIPQDAFHDWWFAIFAANLNGIVYVDEVLTLYRQHGNNVTTNLPAVPGETAPRRGAGKRYRDFLKELDWIGFLRDSKIEKHKAFYTKMYTLFRQKSKGGFVWPLFYFLLKHRKAIFKFYDKSFLSILFDVRKMARGERPA